MPFDAATDGGYTLSGTSHTFAHTCTGSDRLLVVGIAGHDDSGIDPEGVAHNYITGVTYNGVALTLAGYNAPASGFERYVYLYYLSGAPSGTHNVVISALAPTFIGAGAASYTGLSGLHRATTNRGDIGSASLTTTLVTTVDKCWTVCVENTYTSDLPPIAGTGTTRRVYDATFGAWGLFDGNALVTPAGSTSLQTVRPTTGRVPHHVMAAFGNAGQIIASTVFGDKTTVTATHAFAVGLDGNTNVLSEAGKFKIFGNFEVTGTTTLADTVAPSLASLLDSVVTADGEVVIDSDGNVVYTT